MATTTIRVDTDTHALLVELSHDDDATIMETVRAAAESLRRQRFARRVSEELDSLRATAAWEDYLADAEQTSVRDGLG